MAGTYLSGPTQLKPVPGQSDPVALTPPDDLDPKLQGLFASVVSEVPAGLARGSDVRLIVQLCQALHVQAECWNKISADGVLTTDNTHGGELRRHPAVVVWRQATDMARQCMNLLGMSPAARARIQEPGGGDSDPFEAFIRQRRQQTQDA